MFPCDVCGSSCSETHNFCFACGSKLKRQHAWGPPSVAVPTSVGDDLSKSVQQLKNIFETPAAPPSFTRPRQNTMKAKDAKKDTPPQFLTQRSGSISVANPSFDEKRYRHSPRSPQKKNPQRGVKSSTNPWDTPPAKEPPKLLVDDEDLDSSPKEVEVLITKPVQQAPYPTPKIEKLQTDPIRMKQVESPQISKSPSDHETGGLAIPQTIADSKLSSTESSPVNTPILSSKGKKKSYEKVKIKMKVFGTPLNTLLKAEGRNSHIPIIAEKAVSSFIGSRIDEEGIFRISPGILDLNVLISMIDKGKYPDFSKYNVHLIAGLFKKYFSMLPDPLLSFELYTCFMAIWAIQDEAIRLQKIRGIVDLLPESSKELLKYLVNFLAKVDEHSHKNLMTLNNLGTIFGPILLRSEEFSAANFAEATDVNLIISTLVAERSLIFG